MQGEALILFLLDIIFDVRGVAGTDSGSIAEDGVRILDVDRAVVIHIS